MSEIKFLKQKLEDLTGRKIKRKALLKEIGKWNDAQAAWGRLLEYRKLRTVPISGQDMMLIAQASQKDEITRWTKKVGDLERELKVMVKKGLHAGETGAARIMLAGSPMIYPNFKIPSLVEESGGLIVSDELCSGHRIMSDPVMLDERSMAEMLLALAERYFFPCTCPCFSPNDDRIRRMKESIQLFGVEGVVFHTLRGCHLNNLEATKIEMKLREAEIPMIKLESEYDDGDVEQVRTRIEAFVEMIKTRRAFSGKKGGKGS